jgi:G:T-mismatch repair DNA endonuclease (very short patch repair protein)
MNRSELMSRIRSKWTKPEVRYQIEHPKATRGDWLPFRPDFLIGGDKGDKSFRCVFIDGDFWHCLGPIKFASLSEFWQAKLVHNLCRDRSREAFYGDYLEVL